MLNLHEQPRSFDKNLFGTGRRRFRIFGGFFLLSRRGLLTSSVSVGRGHVKRKIDAVRRPSGNWVGSLERHAISPAE